MKPIKSQSDALDRYHKVVIALSGSERLGGFRAQRWGEKFELYDAFDGRRGAGADQFEIESFRGRWGAPPTGGQIGCAISHAEVITAFAQGDAKNTDLLLVAEDDVRWSADLLPIMAGIATLPLYADLIALADPFGPPYTTFGTPVPRDVNGVSWLAPTVHRRGRRRYRVGLTSGPVWGTSLYVITRVAAERFAEYRSRAGKISWLADEYGLWADAAEINVSVMRPRVVEWEGISAIKTPDRSGLHQIESVSDAMKSPSLRSRIAPRTRLTTLIRSLIATRDDLVSRSFRTPAR